MSLSARLCAGLGDTEVSLVPVVEVPTERLPFYREVCGHRRGRSGLGEGKGASWRGGSVLGLDSERDNPLAKQVAFFPFPIHCLSPP